MSLIKQAESIEELQSYIDKIQGRSITPQNYRQFLHKEGRDWLEGLERALGAEGRSYRPLVDAKLAADQKREFMKEVRLELFGQAAVLRGKSSSPLPPVPRPTNDADTDVFIHLREWCVDANRANQANALNASRASSIGSASAGNPCEVRSTGLVFISYAHEDNESQRKQDRWLDRFLQMLKPVVAQEDIRVWSDTQLKAGDSWHSEIQKQLSEARAAVFLVSPAFLASDYIRNSELPVLFWNAKKGGTRILPIVLKPCAFDKARFKYPDPKTGPYEASLSSFQAANSPSKALTEMSESEQDRVLVKVVEALLAQ